MLIPRLIAISTSALLILAAGRSMANIHSATDVRPAPKLHLEEVGADSNSFNVVATLVVGPTELIAWDAQYHLGDARTLADHIAATGKKLKAIVISHPDHDHYSGAAALVERFPGTPVYMTQAAIDWFSKSGKEDFQKEKSRRPALLADSVVTPQLLPSTHLTVDGEKVEVIPDLTGDVIKPTNSILWIPSLRAVLAGDIVFQNVHAWLGSSDEASRTAWRASLKRIADLKPAVVVAGHKRDVSAPDSPDAVAKMDAYLNDYETLRKQSKNADELRNAMLQKYPDYAQRGLLFYASMLAFRPPQPQ